MAMLLALLRSYFPGDLVKQAITGARQAVAMLLRQVASPEALELLARDEAARAYIEAIINDYEAVVRLAIGMRACEIAGIRFNTAERAFHIPTQPQPLPLLLGRIRALVELSNDIERLAQLRAIDLGREREANPLPARGSPNNWNGAARCAAPRREAVEFAKSQTGLILRDREGIVSKDGAGLTALATSRGPPPTIVAPHPQHALQASPARSRAHACLTDARHHPLLAPPETRGGKPCRTDSRTSWRLSSRSSSGR